MAGLAFDGEGNRLTPTYAIKRGLRYRYYVSAPLVRGGSAPNGIRVPAPDLESLVCSTIADRLRDPSWVAALLGQGEQPRLVKSVIDAAADLAESISSRQGSGKGSAVTEIIRELILRIIVTKQSVVITLDRPALVTALPCLQEDVQGTLQSGDVPLEVTVAADILRCGKQVRMVVGEIATRTRSPDAKLIRLVSDAHRWFDDLRTGRAATIAEIASRDRQQVSHVSRTLPLAFLAPDIVEMILDGRQPSALTPERLKARRQPLPLSWAEQRVLLLGREEARHHG